MTFPGRSGGPAFQQQAKPVPEGAFDIFEWHPHFQSCVKYFLDHAQYSEPVQVVAAFINIQLPFQRKSNPVFNSRTAGSPHSHSHSPQTGSPGYPGPSSMASYVSSSSAGKMPQMSHQHQHQQSYTTVIPYIRRLVATGFDQQGVLHGFFGDDWPAGVGRIHEVERRNYLFAAKSDNWLRVKTSYDMDDGQMIPYLKPLQNVSEKEIVSAESNWSEWLAMQDWMLGPRAPVDVDAVGSGGAGRPQAPHPGAGVKMEEQ